MPNNRKNQPYHHGQTNQHHGHHKYKNTYGHEGAEHGRDKENNKQSERIRKQQQQNGKHSWER